MPDDSTAADLGPCAGCRHFDRCTREKICCEAFFIFARFCDEYTAPARWAVAARQPSKAVFERLFTARAAG